MLRLQWLHAAAGHERWKEEFYLLLEEQRRVCATFQFQAREWISRARGEHYEWAQADNGYRAFCWRQSRMYRQMGDKAEVLYQQMLGKRPLE